MKLKSLKFYEPFFFNVCFTLAVLSLAMALFYDAFSVKVFYCLSYIGIVYFIIDMIRKRVVVNRPLALLCISLFVIGLTRFLWGKYFHDSSWGDVIYNYTTGGKRFILGAFLVWFFWYRRHLLHENTIKLAAGILVLGTLALVYFGYHEWSIIHRRIQLGTDSSGTVSYLIVFIFITCLAFLKRVVNNSAISLVIFIAILGFNMALLFLTESRAALLFTPQIYFVYFLFHYRFISWKWKVATLLASIVIIIALVPASVWDRMHSIQTEVSSYDNNNSTSIGARFSIWKSGWHSTEFSLSGQNPDDRNTKARNWIKTEERGNPEAYKNVIYHLHDDLLETLSLQGLMGLLSVLLLYFATAWHALKNRRYELFYLLLTLVMFGLTDTVLIQRQTVMILCLCILLVGTLSSSKKEGHEKDV
ncbi:O-antigen ligase family protein [Enterobacteriaceae bacterium H20N1]|uniref:O-antigen ligase family protein n=1 Tax=Dryocola boscaweniae TaxID=2925397 RepID=A0A9X2W905_9ENTR|nr:O-antigen ligase family protein [Dryocola boscaweniae]MCT4703000.1 O-antigen ligase family protein [Dryocola boscaweniae]MCT4720168.1 O-antigen ligase family protein [Dryocola boscaweniae]